MLRLPPRTKRTHPLFPYTTRFRSIVFGKTGPEISLNAVANLGYAECRWMAPVYPGDTLHTVSRVIGLKENSNTKTGVVYVHSQGYTEGSELVLDYIRWGMVKKRDEAAAIAAGRVPTFNAVVAAERLRTPPGARKSQRV